MFIRDPEHPDIIQEAWTQAPPDWLTTPVRSKPIKNFSDSKGRSDQDKHKTDLIHMFRSGLISGWMGSLLGSITELT